MAACAGRDRERRGRRSARGTFTLTGAAVAPNGRPDAVRLTVPAKPFWLDTCTEYEAESPQWTSASGSGTERLKPGVGTLTVSVEVATLGPDTTTVAPAGAAAWAPTLNGADCWPVGIVTVPEAPGARPRTDRALDCGARFSVIGAGAGWLSVAVTVVLLPTSSVALLGLSVLPKLIGVNAVGLAMLQVPPVSVLLQVTCTGPVLLPTGTFARTWWAATFENVAGTPLANCTPVTV